MPSIEAWREANKKLQEDIDEFQARPELANPYKILNSLAAMAIEAGNLLSPHLKIAGIVIKIWAAGMKAWSGRKVKDDVQTK